MTVSHRSVIPQYVRHVSVQYDDRNKVLISLYMHGLNMVNFHGNDFVTHIHLHKIGINLLI